MINYTNSFFFWLRSRLKIHRGEVKLRFEKKVFITENVIKKEEMLRKIYGLTPWYQSFSQTDYRLLLYRIELLEKALEEKKLPNVIRAADVGSTNFYYAASLHQFYQKHSKLQRLEGIEVDAYRVYDNFHSRIDYAKAYIKGLDCVNYLPMDFINYTNKVNIITMFLPFVFEEPLLKWGLPLSKYQPLAYMKHAYECLERGGIWIITNQGKEEQEKQHELLDALKISYEDKGVFLSDFYTYKIPHFLTVIKKPN